MSISVLIGQMVVVTFHFQRASQIAIVSFYTYILFSKLCDLPQSTPVLSILVFMFHISLLYCPVGKKPNVYSLVYSYQTSFVFIAISRPEEGEALLWKSRSFLCFITLPVFPAAWIRKAEIY